MLKSRSKVKEGVKPKFALQLLVSEIKYAEAEIVKQAQSQLVADIKGKRPLDKATRQLCPYIDDRGLVRVGGRLSNSMVGNKHQIILPKGHITDMMIAHEHNIHHMGWLYTLAMLRDTYWPSRKSVKRIVHKCLPCKRRNKPVCKQKMASLPEPRVEAGKPPFTNTGTDCFGPFLVKVGRSDVKRYGCIFTCFATRAVHIEMLDTLETDSFLHGLRRFTARRGKPRKMYSDNGGNYVGASNELDKGISEIDNKKVYNDLQDKGIEWVFHPPYSHHQGGVWERQIRTIRKILVSILKEQRLTGESLRTYFCEIEYILNNRPITAVSDSIDDIDALRPNHLLMVHSNGTYVPPCAGRERDLYHVSWRQIQYLVDLFWQRWTKVYLPELQVRQKWLHPKENVKVGDLVLITVEKTPRNLWPLARVLEVSIDDDGQTRSAKLLTKSTTLTRPIHQLVVLESELYKE